MPTPDDDIEARVSLLEQEVAQLRERVELSGADAGAARVLASGADRDVSEVRAELRAHTRALNALRETQLDQGDRLIALQAVMGTLQADVGTLQSDVGTLQSDVSTLQSDVSTLQAEMRQGFATMHTGMARITVLLEGTADSEQG